MQTSHVQRGRAALAAGAWADARSALEAAVRAEPQHARAWEDLGTACMWLQDARVFEVRQQAYLLYRDAGDDVAAARLSMDLASDFMDLRGELAVAGGWFQRAQRLLETLPPGREHALLEIWLAYMALLDEGNPASAQVHTRNAIAISAATNNRDTGVLALALQGLAQVTEGSVRAGMQALDEALAVALGGEVSDPQSISPDLLLHDRCL